MSDIPNRDADVVGEIHCDMFPDGEKTHSLGVHI